MNIKDTICDANHLYESYLKSIQNSKWKETTQKFMLNYLRHIFQLQSELENMTYKTSPEEEFTLCERGRIRPITSLQPRDRIVRHVLCDYILTPEVQKKLIYDNGSSMVNKGLAFANKRFKTHLRKYYMKHKSNQGYILFGDFSKFFDNVRHDIAKDQLLELFDYDEYLTWLLDLIFENFQIDVSFMSDEEFDSCLDVKFNKLEYREIDKSKRTGEKFMEKAVNIGDQISQTIGVFYANRLDQYVKTVRSQKYYARYMDDFYIISPSKEELWDIYEGMKVIADELGIFMNDKKTYITRLDKTYKYLQIKYTLTETGKIIERINPKRITALRVKLKKLGTQVNNGNVPYEAVEGMFKGWMGSYYKIMSKAQRAELIKLFSDIFKKNIEIIDGKMIMTNLEAN